MILGREKKRVNIESRLLTDPAIVLLDEPMIGLDSTSAVALMRILHDLAWDEGKTIITSIHQPSLAVFFAFNTLMLLADGSLDWSVLGGYNAVGHHMDLLVVDKTIEDDNNDNNDGSGGNWDYREGENYQMGGVEDNGSGYSTEESHEAPAHQLVGCRGICQTNRRGGCK